jgi:hypothetical protein
MDHGKEISQSQEGNRKIREIESYGLLTRIEEKILRICQGQNACGEIQLAENK